MFGLTDETIAAGFATFVSSVIGGVIAGVFTIRAAVKAIQAERSSQTQSYTMERIERLSLALQEAGYNVSMMLTHDVMPEKNIVKTGVISDYAAELHRAIHTVYTLERLYFPDKFHNVGHALVQEMRQLGGINEERNYYLSRNRLQALSFAIHNYQVSLWKDMEKIKQ